jgi:transcriptional regulator with XRE-family HTH domain
MSKIGKNIKKIRTVKNLNQQDIADFLGLSRASVGAYEEERAEPKIESLIKLAEHFNLDLGRLIHTDLTVNEIHGFKQVEHLVKPAEEVLTPAKITSLPYYHLKNSRLKLQSTKLKWPCSSTNESFAVQVNTHLCLLFIEREKSEIETNLEFVYQKDGELKFGNVIGLGKKEIQLDQEKLALDSITNVYQPQRFEVNLENRLYRLEKIVDGLLK